MAEINNGKPKLRLVNRANPAIVKFFQNMLDKAKRGDIDGYACVYTGPDVKIGYHKSFNLKPEIYTGLDLVKTDIIDDLMSEMHDIE
jgi:hypothetical protein